MKERVIFHSQVRKEPEIQELRQWQREWREESRGIQHKVTDFWEKKMPGGGEPTPGNSELNLNNDSKDTEVTSPPPSPELADK